MEYKCSQSDSSSIQPRIIIHGGAGNITRENLSEEAYATYRKALLNILREAYSELQCPKATALDVATHAVVLLENNGLFNSGHGAVFTSAGTQELEASVMVSRGYRKRGVGVMKVRATKNPIKLAREMLIRGEEENGGGAQGHSQLNGEICDELAKQWGLETVRPSYFFTRLRWDQHRRGLGLSYTDAEYDEAKREADKAAGFAYNKSMEAEPESMAVDETSQEVLQTLDTKNEYVPKGTVGCVVMDSSGVLCVATSTGGITNKLPGRVGDTPTLGAGFWAEEWVAKHALVDQHEDHYSHLQFLAPALSDCLPGFSQNISKPRPDGSIEVHRIRGAAMSGTGNGDSFLRVNAARTAAAMARFATKAGHTHSTSSLGTSLQEAVSAIAGPGGALQLSAEDRWGDGEGEGGIIGIELDGRSSRVVFDYNCGGMFHAWIDRQGEERFALFQDEKEIIIKH